MTAGELQCYLDTIPYDILSEAGKKKYRWIYDELHEQFFGGASSILNIGIDPSVSLEGYYKTNAEIDWLLPYKDRNPVFSLPVSEVTLISIRLSPSETVISPPPDKLA